MFYLLHWRFTSVIPILANTFEACRVVRLICTISYVYLDDTMQTNSPWIHASKNLACKHTGKGKSQQCKEDGKTKNNNTREVGMQLGSWPSWPAHPHNIKNKHDVSTKPCPQRKPVQNWKRTKGGITMEQAESEGNREKWNDYHGCPSWNHSCGP